MTPLQRLCASLALLLLLLGGLQAHGQEEPGLLMLWKSRRPRGVVKNASRILQEKPDALEPMMWLGIAWSSLGYAPDAIGAFRLSPGGALYEQRGLDAHATALRGLGDGVGAAALRQQRLVLSLSVGEELQLWQEVSTDLRAAGDLWGAEQAALQALSLGPQGVIPLILLAEVALDRGALEDARSWLDLAVHRGGTLQMPRLWMARLRGALLSGDVGEQDEVLAAYPALRKPDGPVVALYAEALRQRGEPVEALRILTRSRMFLSEEPEVLAVRIKAAADLYDWPAVRADRELLLRAYAAHPLTALAEAHYQAQRQAAARQGL